MSLRSRLGYIRRRGSKWMQETYYRVAYLLSRPGSESWLKGAEIKYGGIAEQVPRNKVSPDDPRSEEQLARGGMIGGDRMMHHGYGEHYARYLKPYVAENTSLTVVEVGILKGTGLAIWCDLFSGGRVIGLDIDLGHIRNNWTNLKRSGAFSGNEPELYEFDQFEDNEEYLEDILSGDSIDICMDDGLHSKKTIITTLESMIPHLSDNFVYFIEDNYKIDKYIKSKYQALCVSSYGEMTVVTHAT